VQEGSPALRGAQRGATPEVALDELRREIADLKASRARVVAAADAERRRIERDLHDGVQQFMVAFAVNLQLVRQLIDSDPVAATTLIEEIGSDVVEALETVRELAYGIYPPLLLDRGLTEALRAAASRAGIPTRVEAAVGDRFAPDVEATVYFCCLEALRNAAEHAGAEARATVRTWHEQNELHFEVVDDGAGFEQRTREPGVGLTSMSDRLAALDGWLTLSSEVGRGTRVSGTIPLPP
jgi:signal transduction histidine kinase